MYTNNTSIRERIAYLEELDALMGCLLSNMRCYMDSKYNEDGELEYAPPAQDGKYEDCHYRATVKLMAILEKEAVK